MGRFEPSRAQCLFDTQKSLCEMYLITFCFSRNFRSEKLFAESFGTREARKIEPWYELWFQNVYWAIAYKISKPPKTKSFPGSHSIFKHNKNHRLFSVFQKKKKKYFSSHFKVKETIVPLLKSLFRFQTCAV